jgi:diacylglycerol kinase (ATP)
MQNKFLGTGQPGFRPWRKFKTALSGFRYAVICDFSVAYKVALSIIVLILAFIFRQRLDFEVILLATTFMVMAEMFNTTIEALCDFIEPQYSEKIMIIKDIAAAAVMLSIIVWGLILILELIHLWRFWQANT